MSEPDNPRREGEFLEDEVVVEPRSSLLDPRLHDPLIFCPVGPMVTVMTRMFKAGKAFRPLSPASAYTIKYQGHQASLVGPGMGAPAAAYILERAIAGGARHVIVLGLCGSLRPEVRIGDLVVPLGARIEEGVSPHYVTGTRKSFPGERALEAVRASVSAYGKSYHLGPIWTTDAVFRETKKKVQAYGERGLLAVEMECSALFTVAAYRKIELASLLVVSDELFDLRWRLGFTRPRFIAALRHASRIALAAALKLAGKNSTVEPEPESGPEPSDLSASGPDDGPDAD